MKICVYLIIISFFIIFSSCSKQDNCDNPLDCLPLATQTGKNTLGWLENGIPFIPKGTQLGGPTKRAFYTYYNGGYYFSLTGINREQNRYLGVGSNKHQIQEERYTLQKDTIEKFYGKYGSGALDFVTNDEFKGELIITNFDSINGIVSGNFWFDAISEDGEIIEIREGRFDLKL